jgi:hypothetical protein
MVFGAYLIFQNSPPKNRITMKKMIISCALFCAVILAACNSSSSSSTAKDTATVTSTNATDASKSMIASVKYTCKMHPEVISDTLGHCPKCGMKLVAMTDTTMKMSKDSMIKQH